MNPTIERIFEIIRADVCGMCIKAPCWSADTCKGHERRCHAGYTRQAKAIYEQIVQPLLRQEDDLE